MKDALYIVLTLVAFAAFLAYTLGCALLGQDDTLEQQDSQ